ncbi:hypothetical protein [Streptomyces sp. FIT100]|uniref:hypothetical protein n=1 Tax=Streptomyces sp. FIT100 TaxID=2837956 RepID=UPI0021CA01BF|nr:hypothetical protein [Streptomyces sp. FIT100]UUN28765.1 hypothetical protein KK483_22060 [Streptomyces sp. FIT100]
MADERCEWLDPEVAERLLRGEQVGAVGDHAHRRSARRLADALDSVRTPGAAAAPAAEPLRGEEAALAAFRKARDGGADELLPTTVRLAAAVPPSPPADRPRWGRTMRWGLAASLAGIAVGGVAVAAGTGVLPAPFGDDRDPSPAASVSAAATPGPPASGSPTGPDGATTPAAPPSGTGSPPASPSSGATGATGGSGPADTAGGGDARGDEKSGDGTWDRYGSGDRYRRTLDACRDYRSGRLDEERRRKLESAANGPERIKRFCDRLLSGDGSGDDRSDGDGADGGGDHDGSGGGDGDGSGGSGGDNSGDGDGDGGDWGAAAGPGFPLSPVRPVLPVLPVVPDRPLTPLLGPASVSLTVPSPLTPR